MHIRELSVQPREALGQGGRSDASAGKVWSPRSCTARKRPGAGLAVSPGEVQRALHGHGAGGVLVNLRLPGGAEPRAAVVRDLQFDPVRETLVHIDFQAVRMDEEITVEVPIHVVGEAAGVKEQSGVLALLLRAVEVRASRRSSPSGSTSTSRALRIHDMATVADISSPRACA